MIRKAKINKSAKRSVAGSNKASKRRSLCAHTLIPGVEFRIVIGIFIGPLTAEFFLHFGLVLCKPLPAILPTGTPFNRQQDDAHLFITEDQIEAEYGRVLDIVARFYQIFDLSYRLRLGTGPDLFLGDIETWDKAEAALTRILDQQVGFGNYIIKDKDGAFYGPKIDILVDGALGRSWQLGTIQLEVW